MRSPESIDPQLEQKLALLRHATPRNPQAAARGRANYLAQAQILAQAVSSGENGRHKGWLQTILIMFKRKEHSLMITLLSLILVFVLAVGGTGVTAYAAQDSLPTQPLYTVKLATETIRLRLAPDPEAQLDLLLEQAQERVREMVQLTDQGQPIPESVPLRLQTQLDLALQTAARLSEAQLSLALERIRQMAEAQAQILARLRQGSPDQVGLEVAEQALVRARNMAELGLESPLLFRERLMNHRPQAAPTQPERTPASGYGPGPQATPCGECTPMGDQHQYGPQPTEQPGYGPGPQATPCGECTPMGDQNQNGPQSGSGGSGGGGRP